MKLVLEKPIKKDPLPEARDGEFLQLARLHYPGLGDGDRVRKFCVPISATYHRKLFPELFRPARPLPLFPDLNGPDTFLHHFQEDRTPGNTIRKVYLRRSSIALIREGDVLLFYMSKSPCLLASQAITTIGVAERVTTAAALADVLRLRAKRSVFTVGELERLVNSKPSLIKLIDFLLMCHLRVPISLQTLVSEGILRGQPPQSIRPLSSHHYDALRRHLRFGFDP